MTGIDKPAIQRTPRGAVVGRNIHPAAVFATGIELPLVVNHHECGVRDVWGLLRNLNPGSTPGIAAAEPPTETATPATTEEENGKTESDTGAR
jgi:hypothetical protein